MEPQKDSLKYPQTKLANINGRFLLPTSERNLYISPTLNGISGQNNIKVSYQNTLPRPLPEQNLVAPNYYLRGDVAFSQGFRPEINNKRESTESQRLDKPRSLPEQNLVAPNYYLHGDVAFSQGFRPEINYERESIDESQRLDKTFDTGVNKEHEKENFTVNKEPKVSKRQFYCVDLIKLQP